MNWYKKSKAEAQKYKIKIGQPYWFEYHCWESPQSSDAQLWYRSHQQVVPVKLIEKGHGKDEIERGKLGHPAMYNIRFSDGKEFGVFEDELMESKSEFIRPDPPKSRAVKL